jgi:prepilin-type N-terminal cleavage/methylation domain-containing protein
MIENVDADPAAVKNLIHSLRSLSLEEPPCDLGGRILDSLPRRRGFWGRLEYTLKRDIFPHSPSQRSSFFLPSTSAEFGLSLLSAGVFFLVMIAVILVGVSQAVLSGMSGGLLRPMAAFAPAMIAAGLFMTAGWLQLQTRQTVNPPRLRLTAAGVLFGLTAAMGLFSNEGQTLDMIAAWLGLSGIVVAALLLVGMKSPAHQAPPLQIPPSLHFKRLRMNIRILPSPPPATRPCRARCSRGFTLLEVIVVLVLMGILVAVAVTRAMDNTAEARAAADALRTHLRFAQMQAMNSDTTWGVQAVGNSYYLFQEGDPINKRFAFPGEEQNTVAVPARVALDDFTVSFESWGRPFAGADPETDTPLASTMNINVSTRSVSITPETGFIP